MAREEKIRAEIPVAWNVLSKQRNLFQLGDFVRAGVGHSTSSQYNYRLFNRHVIFEFSTFDKFEMSSEIKEIFSNLGTLLEQVYKTFRLKTIGFSKYKIMNCYYKIIINTIS